MLRKLEAASSALAAVALFVLMALTFLDVVGRNIFNHPLPGASELSEILLAVSVFLLLPSLAYREEHIVVELIDNFNQAWLRWLERLLIAGFGGAMFGLIGWRLWILGDKATGYGDASPTLKIPLAPMLYLMAVLSMATALCCFAILFKRRPTPNGPVATAPLGDALAEPAPVQPDFTRQNLAPSEAAQPHKSPSDLGKDAPLPPSPSKQEP